MAVIVCAHCGEQIKRNIKKVTSLSGAVHPYHGECWRKREESRRKEAHRLAYYRVSRVDRQDDLQRVEPKRAETKIRVIGSRRRVEDVV